MIDSIRSWLGPAADELTPEQIEWLSAEATDIDTRYPADHTDKRQAALNAATQYLLGETTAEDVARELAAARVREREAYAAALQVAIMERRYGGYGTPTAAKRAGIDRQGLGRALGEK